MTNRKKLLILAVVLCSAGIIFALRSWCTRPKDVDMQRIKPGIGTITTYISTTGTVEPRNRLEIKPTVNGRIEQILVEEGQHVTRGRILAYMSSSERAALIDAARAQGNDALAYWEKTYKAIPLVAPIDGTVIVRDVEPGQSVLTTAAVLVLSDRLIVKADIDETDIGRVILGQKAVISLDAHPEIEVEGKVSHISYESETVNNVTMYKVEILPIRIPEVFRSGMSANINIVETVKKNILMLPADALLYENGKSYVLVEKAGDARPVKTEVYTGISDDREMEITGGISAADTILVSRAKMPKTETVSTSTNPLLPRPPGPRSRKTAK